MNNISTKETVSALLIGLFWFLGSLSAEAAEGAETASGIVVENVEAGSVLQKAGLRAGDIIFSWERQSSSSTASDRASGELKSVFDWFWLEIEHAPRGAVQLSVNRAGVTERVSIPPGSWQAKVRPLLPEKWSHLFSQAQASINSGQIETGAHVLHQLASEAAATRENELAIWGLIEAASAWTNAGDAAEAENCYKSATSQATLSDNPRAELKSWAELGNYLKLKGELDRALDAYASAESAAKRLPDDHALTVARFQAEQSALAWQRSDLLEASRLSDLAVSAYTNLAPDSVELISRLNLAGMIMDDRGDPWEAEIFYKKALKLAEKSTEGEAKQFAVLNNLGALYSSRGDLITAKKFFLRAAVLLRNSPDKNPTYLAIMHSNLGALSFTLGDLEEAELFFTESLTLHDKIDPKSLAASSAALNLGRLAIEKDDFAKGEHLCKRSLMIRESIVPNSLFLSQPLDCLSLVEFERKNFDTAIEFASRSLRIAEAESPGSLTVAYSLNRLASISYHQGNLASAANYAEKCLLIYSKIKPGSHNEADTLHLLGLIQTRQGKTKEAGELFRRALVALESQIIKAHESEVDRGKEKSSRDDIYLNYMAHLIEEKSEAEAFHVLEQWRARSFLAMLSERDLVYSDFSTEFARKQQRIATEYRRKLNALATATTPEDAEITRKELLELSSENDQFAASIHSSYPKLANLQYPQPLNFESAQNSLDPDSAMLSYSMGPTMTYLFIISPGHTLKVIKISLGTNELTPKIKLLRELLQNSKTKSGRSKALEALSKQLFETLVAPAAAILEGKSKLTIINDGPLHILPWGALISAGEKGTTPGRSWLYLSELKSIHIALSATTNKEITLYRNHLRDPKKGIATSIAAFGDPRYASHNSNSGQHRTEDMDRFYLPARDFNFEELPATRIEVEKITGLYPMAAKAYLGPEATEENVKALPKETSIVHFATHSTLDERFPLDSAVVLSIPEEFKDRENGLLQAWEIFEGFRIDADLVVLSACESGLGKETGGEGLIGLTRAFQYAGARSVMASLWKISDRTTSELMVRFYRHLKEGKPKDEALRAAQMELIRGPIQVTNEKGEVEEIDASAPYYWAAFQIYGDWQ
ncbi:MAG TPA: CHAT domain-containing protein [Thermoanaerobaculia bacterium]|nr:CHAT domain-containing protein [Thermoanaerobaculia bacterium]